MQAIICSCALSLKRCISFGHRIPRKKYSVFNIFNFYNLHFIILHGNMTSHYNSIIASAVRRRRRRNYFAFNTMWNQFIMYNCFVQEVGLNIVKVNERLMPVKGLARAKKSGTILIGRSYQARKLSVRQPFNFLCQNLIYIYIYIYQNYNILIIFAGN